MKKHMIELTKLTKSFGKKEAVSNLSLKVDQGQIFGFLGPNGAGKTTTIRSIMGFISPTSGSIKLFGKDIAKSGVEYKNSIGYLSADNALYGGWNSKEHIEFVASVRQISHDAYSLADRFGLDTNTKFQYLSSGNKQKLGLILAIMHEPDILILDEPTRGLDPILQQEIYTILGNIKKRGGTVFMSSHNLSEVEQVCDQIGIIRAGKLVTQETMQSIHKMKTHIVKVVFADEYRKSDFEANNIEIKTADKTNLELQLTGDINDLLNRLSKYRVHDIQVNHASLEDIFLRYYK